MAIDGEFESSRIRSTQRRRRDRARCTKDRDFGHKFCKCTCGYLVDCLNSLLCTAHCSFVYQRHHVTSSWLKHKLLQVSNLRPVQPPMHRRIWKATTTNISPLITTTDRILKLSSWRAKQYSNLSLHALQSMVNRWWVDPLQMRQLTPNFWRARRHSCSGLLLTLPLRARARTFYAAPVGGCLKDQTV